MACALLMLLILSADMVATYAVEDNVAGVATVTPTAADEERDLHEVPTDWVLPAPTSAMRARGEVKLLVDVGHLTDPEERLRVIGERLLQENVAPVGRLPLLWFKWLVPEQIVVKPPEVGPNVPSLPEPPPELAFAGKWATPGYDQPYQLQVTGDNIAAIVYNFHWEQGPCFLMVNCGVRGQEITFKYQLADNVVIMGGSMIWYADGRGLLVHIGGQRIEGGEDAPVTSSYLNWVYVCEAPQWKPELVFDSVHVTGGWLAVTSVVGQSADGGSVYLRAPVLPYSGNTIRLYRIDTASKSVTEIATLCVDKQELWSVLPAPDGRFLAMQSFGAPSDDSPNLSPLRLIDCRDGSVHAITWRDGPGWYYDSAVAWSAKTPGRLYFIESSQRLWRLDLDIDWDSADGSVP